MLDHAHLIELLGIIVVATPVILVVALGLSSLLDSKLSESQTSRLCHVTIAMGLLAAVGILALMLRDNTRREVLQMGEWVVIPHYHFSIILIFDRLSIPFAILSFLLCGTISAFAGRYMHREQGYNRFFVLYALFLLGMILTSVAGNIETLFTGWELVGLSSVLLVAYFQDRPSPARNGLRVWVIYRISDAALLLAAIVMHHLQGEGNFGKLLGAGLWPEGNVNAAQSWPFVVGLLLVIAAAGKSALVPFSNWLPRAMEGPTPSSAIFYGALSVHLGAFLLLRISPILDAAMWLSIVVVALGLITAVYAYLIGSVQTDIKSALAFASLVQVGLIVAEIGCGLRYIALIHLLGNACLRTLQFLRAPSLLHDYHLLENAIGEHLPRAAEPLRPLAKRFGTGMYRFAIERGYLDVLFVTPIVTRFVQLFQWCDGMEKRWTDFLTGSASRESDPIKKPHYEAIEDLP